MGLQQLGDRLVRFVGGKTGMWRVLAIRLVHGDGLPQAERVAVCRGDEPSPLEPQWTLSGVISNIRYVERPEQREPRNEGGLSIPQALQSISPQQLTSY